MALHDLDIEAYAVMVFDLLVEQAQELPVADEFFLGKGRGLVEKREAVITERILHLILKLSQASVLFTTFDDLFQKWLGRASSLDVDQQMVIFYISAIGLYTLTPCCDFSPSSRFRDYSTANSIRHRSATVPWAILG